MISTGPCVKLAVCLALVPAGPVFTQNSSIEATTTATAPVAYVYVQTTQGVNVYNTNAAGALTLVKGSPFADTGQMEGSNGGYLISVGTDYLHSYAIGANGAVGGQASEINTQSYDGSQCGNTDGSGAIFDHTGRYFYVQLYGASYNGGEDYTCAAWQTYKIESNGMFTFLGANELDLGFDSSSLDSTIPTFSSNDKFTYGLYYTAFAPVPAAFMLASNGVLEANSSFTEKDPAPDPSPAGSDNNYFPTIVAADPSGHLAALVLEPFATPYPGPAAQIASYTINSTGGIQSTNTFADMPTVEVSGPGNPSFTMNMSPAGNLLAVGGYPGLQIFHFNGAAPATTYSSLLLPKVDIDQLAWDSSNHLYALSYSSGELYVYTVTPTSISEVSGSPYKVQNAYGVRGLIVVPK